MKEAVAAFGKSTTAKPSNVAVDGAPEDQLRGPFEVLIAELALVAGFPAGAVGLVGETSLAEDRTRPDYAVTMRNALVGFIEVKAPGKRSGDIVRLEGDVESSGDMIETVVPQMTRWLPEEEAELIRKAFGQALAV
ncbi:MAG: hypothetical protein EPO10_03405 [Reyranella sp.]|uniref:hypothetical protein n=1 Tax=Reyranella sp. TaxID=1929291 RepID=UPI0011F8DD9F|nr:hypothetical protein [Reyranella sp.]TAJ97594.1 MAG: hypothetical protein EPO41_01765 [Reyranella sp.]TBR30335.1 MAG: hypothetical protein EPO10_03405 [Reyranella sp.]